MIRRTKETTFHFLQAAALCVLIAHQGYAAPPEKGKGTKATPAATPVPPPTPAPVPPTPPAEEAKTPIPAEDLEAIKAATGTKITVEGTIVRAAESKSKTVRYLDFSPRIGGAITLVFFGGKGEEVTLEQLQEYIGKKVRATGSVGEYSGRPQMQIEAKSQIVEVPQE